MIVPTLRVTLLQGFGLALAGGCGWGFGFFLQDFGLCMNLSRAVSAPSLRPVIAKNGDTDVQVRRNCLGVQTPCQPTGVFCVRCFMAAARRRSSDLLGVLNRPGLAHLRTVATLIRVQANGGAPY